MRRRDLLITVFVLVMIWQIAALAINRPILPTPLLVAEALWRELASGELGAHFLSSLWRVLASTFLAIITAAPLGGMARRVALARAVVMDPMLIMYDEPFAGLDPISMSVVGSLIRRLNDALGATSIIVTHDVFESLQIVDFLYFMADGVVVGEGTPAEIRATQLPVVHQFVRGEMDGPVPFHYPAPPYAADVGLRPAGAGHA